MNQLSQPALRRRAHRTGAVVSPWFIGMCVSERTMTDRETTTEVRYFIGSRRASAKMYGQALRHHWGIENRQPDNCSSSLLCAA